MSARLILVFGLLLFGVAVFALHTDKMKPQLYCRDSRLWMDGGIDAEVFEGGLRPHYDIKLFVRENGHPVLVKELGSVFESHPREWIASNELKLTVLGQTGHLEGQLGGEKFSVAVKCQ